jgi:hypothetical protein
VSTAGHHATWRVGGVCYAWAMSDEPFPTPRRIEPRGEPPDHGDRPRRVPYDLDTARSAARARVLLWMAQHGGRHPGRASDE